MPVQNGHDETDHEEHGAHLPAATDKHATTINWPVRQRTPVRRFLNLLERLSLAVERPIARFVHSPQWNPLYHTGTITLFALLIILVTGIYLTLFLNFGFVESYQAVAKVENNFLGRLMRALHRYASVLAVVAALLHGWRTFFMDRFRGPRWLAWVTGMVLVLFIWGAGLTGYWLIFDERAQLFNQTLINWFSGFDQGIAFLNRFMLTEAAAGGWMFAFAILIVHLGLSVAIGVFFYLHIKRLQRAKILPPRYWMLLLGIPLLLAALFFPVGMLRPGSFEQLPTEVPLDIFMLWYLPASLSLSPVLFWGGLILLFGVAIAIPWLLRRPALQPAVVHNDRCTGCTLCAADCPYKAITMVEREPGAPHKFLAVIDPKMCVSCGICIGSCPPLAITLGDEAPEPLWQETVARAARQNTQPVHVVFACERHAQQAARAYLSPEDQKIFGGNGKQATVSGAHVEVIPLPCIGMAHPDLAREALRAGATEVQFIGCPPEDCANREGNLWMEQRVERERLPRLRREIPAEAVATAWQPPNDFARALRSKDRSPATSYSFGLNKLTLRGLLPALILLALTAGLSVATTMVPYRPPAGGEARLLINLIHRSGYVIIPATASDIINRPPDPAQVAPTRLQVEVDGQVMFDKTYPLKDGGATPVQILEQLHLAPGSHRVRMLIFDMQGQTDPTVVMDDTLTLGASQVNRITYHDARLAADPEQGKRLFMGRTMGQNPGCQICHSLEPDVRLVGPSLAGVATRAETRVPGMAAQEYLLQSIITPDAYVVEGYLAGQTRPDLAKNLTQQQIDDLVAFLMTLH